jgi:hypothetical protein
LGTVPGIHENEEDGMKKILLTGAFGNISFNTLNELYGRGHTMRCFDLLTSTNQKMAEKFAHFIEVQWGDILKPPAATKASRV